MESDWSEEMHANNNVATSSSSDHGGFVVVRREEMWSGKDVVLDEKWVEKSRKAGQTRRLEPVTQHLDGLNWEVLLVRNPMTNAMCLPGGKIIVFTGLLDHFLSDAEIATIIVHEVGHAVARHHAEGVTKNL